MPPPPVIIITHEFFPYPGGIAVYVREIALALAAAGREVAVWCPPHPCLAAAARDWPFRVVPISGNGGKQGWLDRLATLRLWRARAAEIRAAHVLLAEPGVVRAACYAPLLRLAAPARLSVLLHGSEIYYLTARWPLPHRRFLLERLLARAETVGVVSRYCRDLLLRRARVSPEKIRIAPGALRSDLAALAAESDAAARSEAARSGTGGSPVSPQPEQTLTPSESERVLECGTSVPLSAGTLVPCTEEKLGQTLACGAESSGVGAQASRLLGNERDVVDGAGAAAVAHAPERETEVFALPRGEAPTTPVAKRAGTSGTEVPHSKTLWVSEGGGADAGNTGEPPVPLSAVPLRAADAPFRILCVARIHPRKGQMELLRAVAALPEPLRARVRVQFAGRCQAKRAAYRAALAAFARSHEIQHEFTEPADPAALAALYADADLFALTSLNHGRSFESFGLVYLEAGAFGLPVLAHDTGGVADAVLHDKTSLLVRPDSPDSAAAAAPAATAAVPAATAAAPAALAAALRRLIEDPQLRRRLATAGLRHARAFSWRASAESLLGAD